MSFKSSATTHVGMVRKVNEDSFAERSDIGVWAVADGMGGHEAGEVASATITDHIKELSPKRNLSDMIDSVKTCIHAANQHLILQTGSCDSQRVTGSTVVVLIIQGHKGAVVWAGDSRLYRKRMHAVELITRDHSQAQDLIDQGVIAEGEADSHPMANVITRAVGVSDQLELDMKTIDIDPDDQFLLCSDGLSRLVAQNEIQSMMSNNDHEEVVQSLLHTALVRDAPDNVTLICVKNFSG